MRVLAKAAEKVGGHAFHWKPPLQRMNRSIYFDAFGAEPTVVSNTTTSVLIFVVVFCIIMIEDAVDVWSVFWS